MSVAISRRVSIASVGRLPLDRAILPVDIQLRALVAANLSCTLHRLFLFGEVVGGLAGPSFLHVPSALGVGYNVVRRLRLP